EVVTFLVFVEFFVVVVVELLVLEELFFLGVIVPEFFELVVRNPELLVSGHSLFLEHGTLGPRRGLAPKSFHVFLVLQRALDATPNLSMRALPQKHRQYTDRVSPVNNNSGPARAPARGPIRPLGTGLEGTSSRCGLARSGEPTGRPGRLARVLRPSGAIGRMAGL